jgi:hypothetical protein
VPTSTPVSEKVTFARKPLHIIATDFLQGNDVLVHFSDGSAAIYEAEELEKLRPIPKQALPDAREIARATPGFRCVGSEERQPAGIASGTTLRSLVPGGGALLPAE